MGPERAGRLTGMRAGVSLPTFPVDSPAQQIDHVLLRGRVSASAGEALRLPVSGHQALRVELSLS
ncbi:MAG: endonuclease/exonuclease/phosphatase family protein, partial [Actinomycetes bacterium]